MDIILKVSNLNYMDFRNLSLSFEKNKLYFIVGANKSGKTTLFRIISSLIFTNNIVRCDRILLNEDTKNDYIKMIGVVEQVNKYSFNYKTVKDEMMYPLINLGYSINNAMLRINEVLNIFHSDYIIKRNIRDLNIKEKQLLLIMIALLHRPKVLLIDNVLDIFNEKERLFIISTLKRIIYEDNLTIINFSSNLENIIESDIVIILSHFRFIKETTYNEIYENDKLFYENGLEIPFMFDLVNKLKMYDLIKSNHTDMKGLVDDIWP